MNWLSRGSIILLAFWVVSCNSQVKENFSEDEKEIRKSIQAYVEDFNKRDAEKLGEYYLPDAVYSYPDSGDTIQGREAIVQMFKDMFSGNGAPEAKLKIDKIEITGDRARETGSVEFLFPDKTKQENRYVAETVRQDGKWRISTVSEITLQTVPELSPHLQDLAWLIGKWNDTSDEYDIINEYSWDKYKHFLKQHFTAEVLGQDQLEGLQIIGWDSKRNTIRSWLFDSDGGIGEGTWRNEGDSWYVDMTYVLSDGRTASAQHIYTKESDTQYTFTSINRDIDGEVLPDVGPVGFVKATK
jgi:uncharacterized protein (TIGR02246 family)